MGFPVTVNRGARKYFLLAAGVTVLATSLLLYAGPPSDTIYGNYTGAGQCPPGSAKPCTDTAAMDNVFLERFDKPETDEERQIREMFGFAKADTRVAIRIFWDHGHSCAFEGEMYWSDGHLEFKDQPPARGTVPITCRLQVWEKNGTLAVKDPGNECSEKFCSIDVPIRLAGTRFTKGPDQFLESYKRAVDPPLASIFGTYYGTGKCATDERKSEFCRENGVTDYIIVERNDSGGARVTIGSAKRPDESEDYLCVRDAYAMWFDNRLVVAQETPEHPGGPHALQFGFKGDNVVLNSLWGNHCGSYFQGAVFQRRPVQSGGDVRR